MTRQLSFSLEALIDETVALFHRLRAAAEKLYGEGELSAARRGVLRGLDLDVSASEVDRAARVLHALGSRLEGIR